MFAGDLVFKALEDLSAIDRNAYSGTFYNVNYLSAISLCDIINVLLKSYPKLGV